MMLPTLVAWSLLCQPPYLNTCKSFLLLVLVASSQKLAFSTSTTDGKK